MLRKTQPIFGHILIQCCIASTKNNYKKLRIGAALLEEKICYMAPEELEKSKQTDTQ